MPRPRTALVLRMMVAGSGCLALAACASWAPVATTHCAPVVAERPEAKLTYPDARVIERTAHEASGNVFAGDPGGPWAAQAMAVRAAEQTTSAWYAHWLSSHGWTHLKDQTTTDDTGARTGDVSSWSRSNEFFQLSVFLSESARQQNDVAGSDLLVLTEYIAAPSDLGCA